jgi:hypothetical protein
MSQTLLATLALLIVTVYAAQQQRNIVGQQAAMIQNEVASMATSVAVDRLEEIGSMAFDEHTKDGPVFHPSQLTPYPFPPDAQGDDLDDFHLVKLDTFRLVGLDTLRFMVETSISYVNESNLELATTQSTKYKRAEAKVYSTTISFPDTVRIAQTFSCGSRCQW